MRQNPFLLWSDGFCHVPIWYNNDKRFFAADNPLMVSTESNRGQSLKYAHCHIEKRRRICYNIRHLFDARQANQKRETPKKTKPPQASEHLRETQTYAHLISRYLTDGRSISFLRQKVRAQRARKLGLLERSASFRTCISRF